MKTIIFSVVAALAQSHNTKPFFITLLMLQLGFGSFEPARVTAQVNTFSFLYETPANKRSNIPIEDADGNFITPVSISEGIAYSPSGSDSAFLLKFSPTGDTSIYTFDLPNASYNFSNIVGTSDGGFLVTGSSTAFGTSSLKLLLIKLNSEMEVVWLKQYYLNNAFLIYVNRLFLLDDNGFILTGTVCIHPFATFYPYFTRIDQEGNIVGETIYNYSSNRGYEFILNPSKNKILMFATGLLPNWNGLSVTVLDTTFTFISSQLLQDSGTPPYCTKWLNDTSFIFSYQANKIDLPYQDEEFTIQIRDTLFKVLQTDQFGLSDSFDSPAGTQGLDFRHPDTIFYAASTGLALGIVPPGYTNWFMVRQSDEQLQERYRHFYGGDAYYFATSIIATSDGGCLVSATKHNHETDNYDLVFLKLNSEGMLFGTNDPDIQQRMSLLYPNPASDEVVLETYLDATIIKVFDVNGRSVGQYSGIKGKNTIHLSGLPAGVYVVSLYSRGNFIESHKFVKNPG